MSKSKSDTQLFKLANKATTEILNDLCIAPVLAVRKLITQRIEIKMTEAMMVGYREAFADMNKSIGKTGGKAK